MPGKSDFFDYEPLRGPRTTNAVAEHGFTRERAQSSSPEVEAKFDAAEPKKNKKTDSEAATNYIVADSVQTRRVNGQLVSEAWLLKRGHAFSFAGLFVFTFLVFFRPYEFSPSLLWLSKSALITAIVTLLFFVPTQLGLENRITVRTREVNLVLLLLLLVFISVPLAFDKFLAWSSFVEYSKVVVMFVVMVNVVRTEKRLKALLLLVLAATFILSVTAINDYRVGNLALGGKRIAGVISGLFDNPNDLALHLVTFFPIVVGLALGSRYLLGRLIYAVVAITVLGGVVVTFSRGGFLALIFVVGTLVWRLGKRNRTLLAIVTVLLITLFLILAPGAYRERVATTNDDSAVARTGELKRSIYLALRHPLFGVGMDNFVLFSDTEHATHNSYTQVASEAGLTAGVVYVLFLLAPIMRLRRMPNPRELERKLRPLPYLAIGLQASLIGYMIASFFASVAYLWYVYYLVGYAICVNRLYETSLAKATDYSQPSPARDLVEAIPATLNISKLSSFESRRK
jgi:O-antigen ligase